MSFILLNLDNYHWTVRKIAEVSNKNRLKYLVAIFKSQDT